MLAGISADYYLRLEQGRDHHPSAQVIDALARSLQLDADATAYLHSLAQPAAARRRLEERERTSASIERLIAALPHTPAFVHGQYMDVLAANALATALSPIFSPGVNLVQAVFLDPEMRNLWRDWEALAEATLARLRVLTGSDIDDPRLAELVGDLSARACGRATTSRSRPPAIPSSTTRSWALSSCSRRGWQSSERKASS